MKAKEIQDLINFISETGLEEVDLETEQIKLKIKRSVTQNVTAALAPTAPPVPVASAAPQVAATSPSKPKESDGTEEAADNTRLLTIKSPMIGTFYRSPNPESPSFVNVGDSVKEGDPVCIVEAMKLFNEIESDVSGKIVKVLVENAQPVEYDQPLFLVDPS